MQSRKGCSQADGLFVSKNMEIYTTAKTTLFFFLRVFTVGLMGLIFLSPFLGDVSLLTETESALLYVGYGFFVGYVCAKTPEDLLRRKSKESHI